MADIRASLKSHAERVAAQTEKVKEYAGKAVSGYKRKQAEHQLRRMEEQLQKNRKEQERLEADQKAIEDEKARLVQMDYKELAVEAILAIRGLYLEFQALKEKQTDLLEQISRLETDISGLQGELEEEKEIMSGPEVTEPEGTGSEEFA